MQKSIKNFGGLLLKLAPLFEVVVAAGDDDIVPVVILIVGSGSTCRDLSAELDCRDNVMIVGVSCCLGRFDSVRL